MNEELQKQFGRFSADVADHVVTVLRDDGLYRHLRCRRGSSYTYGFDVVTWPGYLCYTGDMGCFVFARLPDMFAFFRGRRSALVDRGYLAEKAVAADKHDGIREYSESRFQEVVKADFDQFVESEALSSEDAGELWREIEDEVLSCRDNRQDAVSAAMQCRWAGSEVFPDFWEHRLDEYTARFWWCCYAIPWAIDSYDAVHVLASVEASA